MDSIDLLHQDVRIQNSSQMKPTSDTIQWNTWDAQNPACIIDALKL